MKRLVGILFMASAMASVAAEIRSVEEGCADCTEALQTQLDAEGKVSLPAGTFAITNTIKLKDGADVSGVPGRTRIRMNGGGSVFSAAGQIEDGKLVRASGFTFRNLVLEAREMKKDRQAIALRSVENVLVECVETVGLGGPSIGTVYKVNSWDKTPDPCATAGMVGDECLSSNIVIRSCHFDGGTLDVPTYGSLIQFATDIEIQDCVVMNVSQGFQFWGGDSFHGRGGLLKNDKRCKRVKVERCRALNVIGGGIWGSMIQDFLVTNCTVQLCADVGIDFEGCHRAEAVDCVSRDCGNGNYSTFMYCLGDVVFRRCKSILNKGGTCHYFNSNSSLKPAEQHVLFEDCVFTSKKPTLIRVQSALAEFKFVGNKCANVLLDTRATNMGRVICEGNTFEGARGNLEEVMWPQNKPGAPAGDRPPKER